jgi:hypothetical protein
VADVAASTTDAVVAATGILCGSWNEPHIASSFQAVGVVTGPRNWSTASRRWRSSSSKLNHNDKGNVRSHSGGTNRARAAFQKELRTKLSKPPLAPTLQRARVDLQCFPDPTDPSWLQAMNHHRDQHHHQARIDPAPQETHRLRGSPSPAIFFGAAKAIASLPLRSPTRLAIKIGPMQLPAAIKTALLTSLQGQIRIDFLQQLV